MYQELTLEDQLRALDSVQAARFARLTGSANEIATEGIIRHLAACGRHDVPPDYRAVREIIDDALNGRRVYAETV
jgi:hypothetical protein